MHGGTPSKAEVVFGQLAPHLDFKSIRKHKKGPGVCSVPTVILCQRINESHLVSREENASCRDLPGIQCRVDVGKAQFRDSKLAQIECITIGCLAVLSYAISCHEAFHMRIVSTAVRPLHFYYT